MTSEFAIFTISYARDLDSCRSLCKSIDRLFPNAPHYLMIDFWDRRLFREFKREGRKIIYRDRYLPEFLLVPRGQGRRIFLNPYRTRPVGGWFVQQLAKIAAVAQMPYKAVVLTDSDVEFVQPITPEIILRDNKTRMLRYELQKVRHFHLRWNEISHDLLGITKETPKNVNYVENIIIWRPEVVRAMIDHLKARHGSWKRAMLRHNTMSEYYTYGMFVDHVSGPHQDLVFVSDQKLCYSLLYGFEETTEDEETFIKNFTGDYVGFGIQSNIGMPWERREKLAQKLHQAYTGKLNDAPHGTQNLAAISRQDAGSDKKVIT